MAALREYTLASLAVLAAALVLTVARRGAGDRSLWLGLLAFGVLTVLADSALVAMGVFGFGGRFLSGIHILSMPIEDLFYGWALYLVAAAAWAWRTPDRA